MYVSFLASLYREKGYSYEKAEQDPVVLINDHAPRGKL